MKLNRPTRDRLFADMAKLVATRTTCARRAVGCVLVSEQGHVMSTGYNGVARGTTHCRSGIPCSGATAPSGQSLDSCRAIHAEQNALLQCNDVEDIYTAYITASPCVTCVKLLMNTGCQRIVFLEEYPHSDAEELWKSTGREWLHLV